MATAPTGGSSPKPSFVDRFVLGGAFWTIVWRLFSILLILLAIFGLWKVLAGGSSAPSMKLDDGQFMRGLITIVLLFVTLALVVVIIFTSLYADGDDSTSKRVTLSREVITPLFGILGTIIGFYFGAATVTHARETGAAATAAAPNAPQVVVPAVPASVPPGK